MVYLLIHKSNKCLIKRILLFHKKFIIKSVFKKIKIKKLNFATLYFLKNFMKNWTFKKWNTILGWGVFAIAFITYLSTIEPNFSFWDCGEYISSAVKLEVTHAPGAALFQIMGAVAAIFGFGDPTKYSVIINGMSALFSSFTILFLFWTITHLV